MRETSKCYGLRKQREGAGEERVGEPHVRDRLAVHLEQAGLATRYARQRAREIADRVHLSENTVKTHLQEVFRKLGVRNRVEAAIRAVRDGLL